MNLEPAKKMPVFDALVDTILRVFQAQPNPKKAVVYGNVWLEEAFRAERLLHNHLAGYDIYNCEDGFQFMGVDIKCLLQVESLTLVGFANPPLIK